MTQPEDATKMNFSSQMLILGFVCCIAVIFMTIACVQSKIDNVESRLGNLVDYQLYMETFNVMFDQKMQGRDISPFSSEPENKTDDDSVNG